MRLVIKKSIQLCLRTLMFSIVLRHSSYNNRIISIEGTFWETPCITKGLFIWAEVIPVNEKTFQLAKYFSSVHMEKHYPAYREKFPAVT
jgi:hypothetical protein